MQTQIESPILNQLVTKAGKFHTLPKVLSEVLLWTEKQHLPVDRIAAIVQRDPALSAKILHVCNSGYFGLRRTVTELPQAFALLGPKILRSIIISVAIPESLTSNVSQQVLNRYWKQSLYTAIAAKKIALLIPGADAESLFTAGLLRNMGQLILLQELGDSYARFLKIIFEEGAELYPQEMEVFGFSYTNLSAALVTAWELPSSISNALQPRNQVTTNGQTAENNSAEIIYVASLTAEFLLTGHPSAFMRALQAACDLSHLTRETLRSLLLDLEQDAAELAPLYNICMPEVGYVASLVPVETQDQSASVTEYQLLQATTELRKELQSVLQKSRGSLRNTTPPPLPVPEISAETLFLQPKLLQTTAAAIVKCRNQRQALSLVLLALDTPRNLREPLKKQSRELFTQWLVNLPEHTLETTVLSISLSENHLALLLEDCDKANAVSIARRCVDAARQRSSVQAEYFKLSGGVATLQLPPRNFPESEMIEAAQRCLRAAQASGGDTVKSIDL